MSNQENNMELGINLLFFYNEDNEFESEEIEVYERLAEAVREVRGIIQRNSR